MKILIISPAYPPISSVGVVRMSSLTSFLRDEGDEVTVLCDAPNSDNSNGNAIHVPEGISTVRIDCLKKNDREKVGLYRKALETVLNQNVFDIALVTVGPYFPLRFVVGVFRRHRVPYVIDFRDVGALDSFSRISFMQTIKVLLARAYEFFFEFRAIAASRAVVSVTEGWMKKKRRDYFLFAHKMHCIANGFDGDRLKTVAFSNTVQEYTLAIIGKLAYYSVTHAFALLAAIKELAPEYPGIMLLHICDREEIVDKMVKELGLSSEQYVSTGFMDYVQGVKLLSTAAAGVIVDSRKDAMGTKIYDYLFLNKPILYVGTSGTCLSSFVQQFENGFVCETKEEVVTALRTLFDCNKAVLDSRYDRENYSRESRNVEYRALLKSVIEG